MCPRGEAVIFFVEHVFNVLELFWIWHVENVPHEFFHKLGVTVSKVHGGNDSEPGRD